MYDDEDGRKSVQDTETRPQLPSQPENRQAGALLSAGCVVHQDHGREGADGGIEQDHRLETGIYRHRTFRTVAGEYPGLEPLQKPFLGNTASYLAYRGRQGREVHRKP